LNDEQYELVTDQCIPLGLEGGTPEKFFFRDDPLSGIGILQQRLLKMPAAGGEYRGGSLEPVFEFHVGRGLLLPWNIGRLQVL